MASTKDMTLLPREVLVVPEAIRLGGGGQVEEWRLAYSPLEGEGRLTLSAAKCETGRGDLSTRALLDVERPSPHPAASRRPTSELRSSRTPPGEGKRSRRRSRDAAVDHDGLAGHEGGGVGRQIGHRAGDFFGFADAAQRRTRRAALQVFRIFPQRAGEIGLDQTRRHAIDA